MPTYEHKQWSPWPLPVLAVIFYALLRSGFVWPESAGRIGAFAVVAAMVAGFTQLTTRVDSNRVSWAFTLGIPSGSISIADIADAHITEMRFWEGYGIHWTILHGWLWNVAGFQGVTIRKKGGGGVTLGTDDPRGLYEAIQTRR